MKKIYSLNAMRGIAITGVFLSHLSYVKSNINTKELFDNFFFEGYIGVIFFFMLAGYFSYYTYKEKSSAKYLLHKLKKFYPIHILTLAIFFVLGFGSNENLIHYIIKAVINMLLLQSFIPVQEVYFSFNPVTWFLSDVLLLYFLTPKFINLVKTKFKLVKLSIIIYVFVVIVMGICLPEKHWLFYINPFFRIGDYLIGIMICYYFMNKNKTMKRKKENSSKLEIISIAVLFAFFILHKNIPQNLRYDTYYIIPFAFIIYAFSFDSGIISKILKNNFFQKLGDISLEFFMIHLLIIKFISRLEFVKDYPIIMAIVNFALCYIICYICVKFKSYISCYFNKKGIRSKLSIFVRR